MLLGIDPGVRKLGYALVEDDLSIVDAGVVLLEHDKQDADAEPQFEQGKVVKGIQREEYWARMAQMYDFFVAMWEEYGEQIKTVCVEKLYFTARNQSNAEFVYGSRGIVMMLAHKHGCRILEYTPIQLKKYITGNSKASKSLMTTVVKKLYGLDEIAYHDTADALGLAYLASRQQARR